MTKIYIVTNIDDNPYTVYVGKTSINTRKSGHKLKFGKHINFEYIDEIQSEDKKDWKPLESYWIDQFKAWGYNVLNKNEGGGGLKNHTQEVKDRMSQSRKGLVKSKDWIDNISKANKGLVLPKFNCKFCSKELGGKGNLSIHEKCCKSNPDRIHRAKTSEWLQQMRKPRPKENYKKSEKWRKEHSERMKNIYLTKNNNF